MNPCRVAPLQVHPNQHRRPVLGIDAALARVNDHDGVRRVVGTGERQFQFEFVDPITEVPGFLGDLRGHLVIVAREFDQFREIVRRLLNRLPPADPLLEFAKPAHQGLRRLRIVPDRRVAALPFEVAYFTLIAR